MRNGSHCLAIHKPLPSYPQAGLCTGACGARLQVVDAEGRELRGARERREARQRQLVRLAPSM